MPTYCALQHNRSATKPETSMKVNIHKNIGLLHPIAMKSEWVNRITGKWRMILRDKTFNIMIKN